MRIHKVEQSTLAWLILHIGIPTASGLDNLVDGKFDLRTGETPKTYLHKKLAESWRGKPMVDLSASSFMMEQGMILESEARPWLALHLNKDIKQVGFITTDDGKFGCSPDGLISDEQIGLEIKCPTPHVHVKYLLGGNTVPKEYVAQVHGSMFATGFKKWMFVSYRRGYPALIVTVQRDEAIQAKIKAAVEKFHEDFNRDHKVIAQLAQDSGMTSPAASQQALKQEQS